MNGWITEKATDSRFRARIDIRVSYSITKYIFTQDPGVVSALTLQRVWLRTDNHTLTDFKTDLTKELHFMHRGTTIKFRTIFFI